MSQTDQQRRLISYQAPLMKNPCLSQRFRTVMDGLTQQCSQIPSYDSSYLTCLHFLLLSPASSGILQIHWQIAHLEYKTQGLHLRTLLIDCTSVKVLGVLAYIPSPPLISSSHPYSGLATVSLLFLSFQACFYCSPTKTCEM